MTALAIKLLLIWLEINILVGLGYLQTVNEDKHF